MADAAPISNIGWVISTSAPTHMCNSRSDFHNYAPTTRTVHTANGQIPVHGRGKVVLEWLLPDGNTQTVKLSGVWHVPGLRNNHLSASALQQKGVQFNFDTYGVRILVNNQQIGQGTWQGGLLMLSLAFPSLKIREATRWLALTGADATNMSVWHRRMAHLGHAKIRCLAGVATGVTITPGHGIHNCESCISRQAKKKAFWKPPITTTAKLQLIHAEVGGPITPTSFGGARYYVTFADDFTRATWIYFIQDKRQCPSVISHFKSRTESESGFTIQRFRAAEGGSFNIDATRAFLAQEGIEWESRAESERLNPTLVDRARCMLRDSGLPPELWTEALNTAVYLRNRSPQKALLYHASHRASRTSFEAWYDRQPDLSHIRVFGSKVYAEGLDVGSGPMRDGRRVLCFLLGYGGLEGEYLRLWSPHARKVVPGRDVVVVEEERC